MGSQILCVNLTHENNDVQNPTTHNLQDPIHDANAVAEAEMPDFGSLKDEVAEKMSELDGQFVAELADRIRSFGRNLFSRGK